jgi:hypothetical protein
MEVLILYAMMATTKCESIQAAVIMPNKRSEKLKEEQKRTDQIYTKKLQ